MSRSLTLAPGLVALAILLCQPPALRAQQEDAAAPTAAADVEVAHGPEAHDEAGEPNILEPQLPLAFWTLVVFLLLLLVLWYFAWGPLSKALHDREQYMQETVQRAEQARADAERLLAEHRKLVDQANLQAAGILDEARRDAEVNAETIRRTAQQEAESTLSRARREIETARDQALVDVWNRTAELAVSVAGKVLGRELHDDDHRRLVEVARDELPENAGNGSAGRSSQV